MAVVAIPAAAGESAAGGNAVGGNIADELPMAGCGATNFAAPDERPTGADPTGWGGCFSRALPAPAEVAEVAGGIPPDIEMLSRLAGARRPAAELAPEGMAAGAAAEATGFGPRAVAGNTALQRGHSIGCPARSLGAESSWRQFGHCREIGMRTLSRGLYRSR